ncbi:hypothetical protein [Parapedobacter tibetensis]|uniref:hypothetical protein n=1 Tax=Parapedobacter tibetensis TaxID=2972951 RepID=UPI00214DE070|nr:hypothetical protein [Parapedobacter tibetensis]
MKTSNKLLMALGIALLVATIVNAWVIKAESRRIINQSVMLETFPIDSITEVVITGTAPKWERLQVQISHSDKTTVQHTQHDFIHISKDGNKLNIAIDHPKDYEYKVIAPPEVMIHCPRLTRFSMVGTPLDSLDLPEDTHIMTRRNYARSVVKLSGLRGDRLELFVSNGAELTLTDTNVDSLHAAAGAFGKLIIDGNTADYAYLRAGKDGEIEATNPKANILRTHIDPEGELIMKMKGTDATIKRDTL